MGGVAVATESSYPYTARDGSCKSSYTTAIPRGGVNGYHDVSPSTSSLQSALVQQPVSVAIQADQSVFQRTLVVSSPVDAARSWITVSLLLATTPTTSL